MEQGVNIHLPPIGVNLKNDAQDAIVGRLDVSVPGGNIRGSPSYGTGEPIRIECQEIIF